MNTKKVVVYNSEYIYNKLESFINSLCNILENIPEEYRYNAIFEVDADLEDGQPFPNVAIFYNRSLTHEEQQDRIYNNNVKLIKNREAEIKELARLKAKYE